MHHVFIFISWLILFLGSWSLSLENTSVRAIHEKEVKASSVVTRMLEFMQEVKLMQNQELVFQNKMYFTLYLTYSEGQQLRF